MRIDPRLQTSALAYNVHVGPGLGMQDFEIGASLMALLVHPQRSEEARRLKTKTELCGGFAAAQLRSVPFDTEYLRSIKPEYFEVGSAEARNALRQVSMAFRRLATASLIARPFIGPALREANQDLPEDLGRLNVSNVAQWIGVHHELIAAENILHRRWRPTLPVLPLAVALERVSWGLVSAEPPSEEGERIRPALAPLDLQDIKTWKAAVHLSHTIFEIVRADRRIRVPDDDLIWINWYE